MASKVNYQFYKGFTNFQRLHIKTNKENVKKKGLKI